MANYRWVQGEYSWNNKVEVWRPFMVFGFDLGWWETVKKDVEFRDWKAVAQSFHEGRHLLTIPDAEA